MAYFGCDQLFVTKQMRTVDFSPSESPSQQQRYAKLLGPGAAQFTFQFFIDNEALKNDSERAKSVTGWCHLAVTDPELKRRNDAGAGVYCTVNETDFQGRSIANIVRVRSVFQEDDDGFTGSFPLEPTFVIESSPGHFHRYWSVTGDWPADKDGQRDFRNVMERMIASYGSCPGAKDISRVLRVPGFFHLKSKPFLVRIVKAHPQLRRYTRHEILTAFPPLQRKERCVVIPGYDRDGRQPSFGSPKNKVVGILAAVAEAHEGNRNSISFGPRTASLT